MLVYQRVSVLHISEPLGALHGPSNLGSWRWGDAKRSSEVMPHHRGLIHGCIFDGSMPDIYIEIHDTTYPIDLSDYPIDPYVYIYIFIQMRIENRWPIPEIYLYIHIYIYIIIYIDIDWHTVSYIQKQHEKKTKTVINKQSFRYPWGIEDDNLRLVAPTHQKGKIGSVTRWLFYLAIPSPQ